MGVGKILSLRVSEFSAPKISGPKKEPQRRPRDMNGDPRKGGGASAKGTLWASFHGWVPTRQYFFPRILPLLCILLPSHLFCVTLTVRLPTLPYTHTCTHKHMCACTPMHTGTQCMYTPQFLSHGVGVSLWRLTRLKLGSD